MWNASDCEATFESLPNIHRVACNLTTDFATERTFTVSFRQFPTFPHENNLFHTDGQFSTESVARDFHCDTTQVTGVANNYVSCSFAVVPSNATLPGQLCPCFRVRCVLTLTSCRIRVLLQPWQM